MADATWIYQGRQEHGWFGSGTAPRDAAAAEKPGAATPSSLAERVLLVAYGAIAEMPREQRARFERQLGMGALKSLTQAMPAWVRSAGLDAESFRQHFFPYDSARAAAGIQAVAAAVGHGGDLGPATTALADAVQAIGLDNAPRALAAAAERAANSAAPAAVPAHSGLVKKVAYDPALGYDPAVHTDSPTFQKLAKGYNPSLPTYHGYEFYDMLGKLGENGLTVESAYHALLQNAVPGGQYTGRVIPDLAVSTASFLGVGGQVRTLIEPSTHSIFNVTFPSHILANGFVQRQIVVDGDTVMVRTTGMGNNSSPAMARLNTEAAKPAFAGSTYQMRLQLGLAPLPAGP